VTTTKRRLEMYDPPHPGEVLRELYIEPLGLSVTNVAAALRTSRKNLSALLNGRAGVSPEMALRLAQAFDTTPESWLNLQTHRDLWAARAKVKDLRVRALVTHRRAA
jgi:addiction module HigA family antidote